MIRCNQIADRLIVYDRSIHIFIKHLKEDDEMSTKTDHFIEKIAPLAISDMAKTKVLASLTIAQAILESGWGESELAVHANNLFGMKATDAWRGVTYTKETREYKDNEPYNIKTKFKVYDGWAESIRDHSSLLQKERYTKVLEAKDYKVACEEIYQAGYATDPNYPNKLIGLIEQYDLQRYDFTSVKETGLTLYYRVVVGSYTSRVNARAQQQALEHEGFKSFLVTVPKDGVDYLRVIVGSYTSQENALSQQAKLKAKGFNSFLVADYV